MRIAFDTNVLAYAEGTNGPAMKEKAVRLIETLPQESVALPAQVLGELFNVLVKKARRSPAQARAALLSWNDAYPPIETSGRVIASAVDLAADHQLSIWDAVILSAAADARCRLLLSEDLQDGFTWSGVTVTNPFGRAPHPLLVGLIADAATAR